MSFFNKRQIKKALSDGHVDIVAKQLNLYGSIINDKEWESGTNAGPNAGHWRRKTFDHHSLKWDVYMHNGEVKSVTLYHNEY